jgi:Arc/MetJ-type ribon-helix-helix transcriptional regulator
MAGRSENTVGTDKVHATLPIDVIRSLEVLLASGRYGTNLSDVTRYLLVRSVDDLTRAKVLPPLSDGDSEKSAELASERSQ